MFVDHSAPLPIRRGPSAAPKLAYIDALRGYAVLLVITAHVGGMLAQLPYPLKKLTNYGVSGVQLFFLLSCVTLLLSWQADQTRGSVNLKRFWFRRFCRIAPMYYLAAAFYFWAEPPAGGFDPGRLLASLLFVNAWHPALTSLLAGYWQVVPGGWSIGVEMNFYLLFPLIAAQARSMRTALMFAALALLAGSAANLLVAEHLPPTLAQESRERFLFFWLPNQIVAFALGTVLHQAMGLLGTPRFCGVAGFLQRRSTAIVIACVAASIVAANLPLPQRLPVALPLLLPTYVVASLIYMVLVATLANAPASPFVNEVACSFGKVSFSAYLLHFFVLHRLCLLMPSVFDRSATGWHAILVCAALWAATVPITYGLSKVTFQFVEQPCQEAGARLLRRRWSVSALAGEPLLPAFAQAAASKEGLLF